MLGRLFRRDSTRAEVPPRNDRFSVAPPNTLLAAHANLIVTIRGVVGVPDMHWATLYDPLLSSFAGLVQQLPASEAHHHCGPGGLLRHALEVVLEAMKLRRGALLPPGASAEELARLQDVWTYACVSAALLHDVGKPLADQRITLFRAGQNAAGPWSPMDGPMPPSSNYQVEFVAKRRYRRHERLAPLLAAQVMPPAGLRWLASEPEALDAWLATLMGEYEEAGPLGAIVAKADGLSVARDLSGGRKVQLPTARTRPLSDRLLTALRYLLDKDELPLNRRGAAGFLAGEDLWLVSKRVLDALKEHLAREGQTGVPSRNDRLMDELQQHGLLVPNDNRAIWTCDVRIGDWAQQLTLLRIEASLFWPDPDRRPAPLEGTVTPLAGPSEAGDQSKAHISTEKTAASAVAADIPGQSAEEVARSDPGTATDGFDDLPLPYDFETPQKVETRVESDLPTSPISPQASPIPSPPPKSANTARGDIPPADSDEDSGRRFVAWLKDNIASGRVEINTVNARLHVLPEGLALVSPGIFRDFDPVRWDKAQKRFQKMKLHQKTPEGTNIWNCRVAKDRKQSVIKVMLIPGAESAIGVKLPPPNPVVRLLTKDGQTPKMQEGAQ